MELVSNPEPNSLWPASSEDQELGCLYPINSEPKIKVNINLPGSEFLPASQDFSSNLPVSDYRSFPNVTTCNTGNLGSKLSSPANKESSKPVPVLNAGSFPEIPTHDTGRLLGKISKSTNDICPKPAQSLENGAGSEYLPNINYQAVKQKGLKVYSSEMANGDLPMPDATLPPLES
ncbi:hypothetical protein DSO57_1038290 [Entomophthora muscae]|uniref:Uncharacterized protein n=1 Tax=Entomophthora muscae TaxID=34485 RepID=A0ACC2UIS3_9FUNG|nr:hypothetical protein DSO57_1038290 [Entomophthora muscae]